MKRLTLVLSMLLFVGVSFADTFMQVLQIRQKIKNPTNWGL